MMSIDDSNVTANKPADPTPTPEERILSIFALLADLASGMRSIASRLDTMEHRIDSLNRGVLPTLDADARAKAGDRAEAAENDDDDGDDELPMEPDQHEIPPALALRCDGRILLSTRDLERVDLTMRETFIGIVLSEAETSDVLDLTDDAFCDVAAHITGLLRRKAKPVTSH